MRPLMILFIAYTTLMPYYVSGAHVEHPAAYDRVVECISLATHAHRPEEHLSVMTETCDAFKAMYRCLIKPFDSTSDSSTEILDFYRAYQLQRTFLDNKMNICGEALAYSELEKLVKESGIMEKENLPSIEKDEYVPCEGEISTKCEEAVENAWESHSDDLHLFVDYLNCYDKESATCNFPIVQHMNAIVQAIKKHLKEKHGLLGGMLEQIKQ
ncbi:uncharacterized protein LOC144643700 isoform X2 [Oculina patagonica]